MSYRHSSSHSTSFTSWELKANPKQCQVINTGRTVSREMKETERLKKERGIEGEESDLVFFGPTPLAIISHQLCYIAFDLLLVCCYRVLTLHRNWQNWSEMSESASPLGVAALLSLSLHYCNDLYITVTPCLASDIWGRTWLVNQSGQLALFCPSHLPYCHPSLYLACKMSKYISVKFMVIDQKRPTGLTLHNYAGSYVL